MKSSAILVTKRIALVVCVLSQFIAPVWAENPDDCAEQIQLERGKNCSSSESVQISLTNRCDKQMDLRFCLEMQGGKWNCGTQFNVPSGKVIKWLTCEGTGKSMLWARTPQARVSFPDENGSYRSAGHRVFALANGETEISACMRAKGMANSDALCDCESQGLSSGNFRCRVPIADDVANALQGAARPFDPIEFSVRVTSQSKDAACAEARKLAFSPTGACVCDSKGLASTCRVTSSIPPAKSIVNEGTELLRCDPLLDNNCFRGTSNNGNGIRN